MGMKNVSYLGHACSSSVGVAEATANKVETTATEKRILNERLKTNERPFEE
jgi:hypothetical protein